MARFLLILSLVVWLGGITFFSFVVAPALFAMLPNPQVAGAVVRVTLVRLHVIGIACRGEPNGLPDFHHHLCGILKSFDASEVLKLVTRCLEFARLVERSPEDLRCSIGSAIRKRRKGSVIVPNCLLAILMRGIISMSLFTFFVLKAKKMNP